MAPASDSIPVSIHLPVDLMVSAPWISRVDAETTLKLIIPADYEFQMASAIGQSEVLGIQRILTLARKGARFEVVWDEGLAKRAATGF